MVAGWEERKKIGKGSKFGRLLFIKGWKFLDENFTVNGKLQAASKHFQCKHQFSILVCKNVGVASKKPILIARFTKYRTRNGRKFIHF
jgi:hypothetical protein